MRIAGSPDHKLETECSLALNQYRPLSEPIFEIADDFERLRRIRDADFHGAGFALVQ